MPVIYKLVNKLDHTSKENNASNKARGALLESRYGLELERSDYDYWKKINMKITFPKVQSVLGK